MAESPELERFLAHPLPAGMKRWVRTSKAVPDPDFAIERAEGSCACSGSVHRVELLDDGSARLMDHGRLDVLAAIGQVKEDRTCREMAERTEMRAQGITGNKIEEIPDALLLAARRHSVRRAAGLLREVSLPGEPGSEVLKWWGSPAKPDCGWDAVDVRDVYAADPFMLGTCLLAMHKAREWAVEQGAIGACMVTYFHGPEPMEWNAGPASVSIADPAGRVVTLAAPFFHLFDVPVWAVFDAHHDELALWSLAQTRAQLATRDELDARHSLQRAREVPDV